MTDKQDIKIKNGYFGIMKYVKKI